MTYGLTTREQPFLGRRKSPTLRERLLAKLPEHALRAFVVAALMTILAALVLPARAEENPPSTREVINAAQGLPDRQQEAIYCRLALNKEVPVNGLPSHQALVAHCAEYL